MCEKVEPFLSVNLSPEELVGWHSGDALSLWCSQIWVPILAQEHFSYVTLEKLLALSLSTFSFMGMG